MAALNAEGDRIHVGMVGAGRTRNGLGPFLADFLESAGFLVSGVSGRSRERASVNADALGARLGHDVRAFASPAALCSSGVTALVISSPPEHHVDALRAAGEAGLPTLCEKPLVHERDVQAGAEIVESFARERIPLMENCQWPYVLPAFVQLHGAIPTASDLAVEMGLGPARLGRESVQNTVSHLLSVIQAVANFDPDAFVRDARLDNPVCRRACNVLRFRLAGLGRTVDGVLHLEICAAPPRPAWLAIAGRRMDRNIREGQSIVFSANNREVAIGDPMKELVKHFALLVRSRDPVPMDLERDQVRQRLEWYRQILEALR